MNIVELHLQSLVLKQMDGYDSSIQLFESLKWQFYNCHMFKSLSMLDLKTLMQTSLNNRSSSNGRVTIDKQLANLTTISHKVNSWAQNKRKKQPSSQKALQFEFERNMYIQLVDECVQEEFVLVHHHSLHRWNI